MYASWLININLIATSVGTKGKSQKEYKKERNDNFKRFIKLKKVDNILIQGGILQKFLIKYARDEFI